MTRKNIEILDTTLRDGEQTTGVAYTGFEKLAIAKKLLDNVKIHRVEIASARVSEGEKEGVKKITDWAAKNNHLPKIEVLGFVDGHRSIDWIHHAGGRVINLLTKGSMKHLAGQLKKTPEEHISDITKEVSYAQEKGMDVNIYLEDWSNGMINSRDYVYFMIENLTKIPVKRIMLPDTLGILAPEQTRDFCLEIRKKYPTVHFDFHAHNDYDLAVANTLAAIKADMNGTHVTVNGLGERAGNAPLSSVIAVLHDYLKIDTGIEEAELNKVSRLVEAFSGIRIPSNQPLIGDFVFTQVAGVHADGDAKNKLYFSKLLPERFGRIRLYALGKTSGKANIQKNIEALGYELNNEELERITQRVVELSDKKETVTQEDLPYIIADVLDTKLDEPVISVASYSLSLSKGLSPLANVKLVIGGKEYEDAARGDGQYDAFFNAVKKIYITCKRECPELINYSVSIPPGGKTDALVETTITWRFKNKEFKTKGLDGDQVIAAIEATMKMLNIVDGISSAQPSFAQKILSFME